MSQFLTQVLTRLVLKTVGPQKPHFSWSVFLLWLLKAFYPSASAFLSLIGSPHPPSYFGCHPFVEEFPFQVSHSHLSCCIHRASGCFVALTPSPLCSLLLFFSVASSAHTSKSMQGKTTRQETFTGPTVAKWLEATQENFPAHRVSKCKQTLRRDSWTSHGLCFRPITAV